MLKIAIIATALATTPVPPAQNPIQKAIDACAQGYVDYKYGKATVRESLENVLLKFPADERPLVAIICVAYEAGHNDGKRGIQ